MISFVRPGPRVGDDELLIERLAGDGEPSPSLVLAAACHNLLAWEADRTLNTTIVVAADPQFARVGEMLETDAVATTSAGRFEAALLQVGAGAAPSAGDDELDRYLGLRQMSPGKQSRDRFVAYVTNTTTSEQRFVLVDVASFHPASVRSAAAQAGTIEVIVAGGSSIPIEATDCDRFVPEE